VSFYIYQLIESLNLPNGLIIYQLSIPKKKL